MTAINSNRAIRGPVTAVPVVAGKGVRLVADTDNNRWIVEADETVLWEGTQAGAYTFQLSETLSNFEKFRIAIGFDQGIIEYKDVAIPSGTLNALGVSVSRADSSAFWHFAYPLTFNADKTSMSIAAGKGFKCGGSNISQYYNNNTEFVVYGIWGINRIASA